jgi:hypothetical protein
LEFTKDSQKDNETQKNEGFSKDRRSASSSQQRTLFPERSFIALFMNEYTAVNSIRERLQSDKVFKAQFRTVCAEGLLGARIVQTTPQAADYAIAQTIVSWDMQLPKTISFNIVSLDKGFQTVKIAGREIRQMNYCFDSAAVDIGRLLRGIHDLEAMLARSSPLLIPVVSESRNHMHSDIRCVCFVELVTPAEAREGELLRGGWRYHRENTNPFTLTHPCTLSIYIL